MSVLRSSRNLLAPPTLIRAGNPERHPSGDDPGVKSFPTVPCMSSYMNWEPGYPRTNAEFNRDMIHHHLGLRLHENWFLMSCTAFEMGFKILGYVCHLGGGLVSSPFDIDETFNVFCFFEIKPTLLPLGNTCIRAHSKLRLATVPRNHCATP